MNKKLSFRIFLFFAIFFSFVGLVIAQAKFSPGETLNPNCLPTDPTCTVSTNTSTNSSIWGLITGKLTDQIDLTDMFKGILPPIVDNKGKYLMTDGTTLSWVSLPISQTQNPVLNIPVKQLAVMSETSIVNTKYMPPSADMSINTGEGDYIVTFSTSVQKDTPDGIISIALFKNGILIPESEVFYSGPPKGFGSIYTTAYITQIAATDTIGVSSKISIGNGLMKNRTLITQRVK